MKAQSKDPFGRAAYDDAQNARQVEQSRSHAALITAPAEPMGHDLTITGLTVSPILVSRRGYHRGTELIPIQFHTTRVVTSILSSKCDNWEDVDLARPTARGALRDLMAKLITADLLISDELCPPSPELHSVIPRPARAEHTPLTPRSDDPMTRQMRRGYQCGQGSADWQSSGHGRQTSDGLPALDFWLPLPSLVLEGTPFCSSIWRWK
ncbi:hypothetical protein J6590_037822 [Homalodisca vitripennis]|nr:hypothetical protein J6590_037822 [Homalodisca vitripennis]